MMDSASNFKVWQDAVSAREDCPPSGELLAVSDNPSGDCARHVQQCPYCQAELALLKSFESPGAGDNEQDIAAVVARLQARSPMPIFSPPRKARWRAFLQFPYLAGAVAAVLVAGLGISLYFSSHAEKPSFDGNISGPQTWRSASVRLTAPSGNLAQAPESFQWEAFPGAKSYSFELLEVDGSVLWREQSEKNILFPGPELKAKIQLSKPLLWKVVAQDASGKTIATSSPERFFVKSIGSQKH